MRYDFNIVMIMETCYVAEVRRRKNVSKKDVELSNCHVSTHVSTTQVVLH